MATAADFERLGKWAVILNPDLNIDRRKCHRTTPLEVLNLGAPRTGTLSMTEAYEILGYQNPYHYASIFANCRDSDMWLEALDAKYNNDATGTKKQFGRAEFDKLLGDSAAVADVPCIMFWRELVEAYLEARVVLVHRDEEKWLESIRVAVVGILNPVGRYILRFTDPGRTGRILGLGLVWMTCWFRVEGSISVEKAMKNAPQTYRDHYAAIRATVPRERLLEYRLGSGWKPLCQFLGKEVPDQPFPHRNDAATLDRAFGVFLKGAFIRSLRNLGMIAATVSLPLAFSMFWKSRSS